MSPPRYCPASSSIGADGIEKDLAQGLLLDLPVIAATENEEER